MPEEKMKPGDLAVSQGQLDGSQHDEIYGKDKIISIKATAEGKAIRLFPDEKDSAFRLVYVEMYKMACREARRKQKQMQKYHKSTESEAASC